MPKVLITNSRLFNIAGSELTLIEVANYFANYNWEIHIYCHEISNLFIEKIESLNAKFSTHIRDFSKIHFDLCWIQHNSCADQVILAEISYEKIIYLSMSHFVDIEAPPAYIEIFDILLFHSKENQEKSIGYSIPTMLFENPISLPSFPSCTNKKQRLCIVSNHPPIELLHAANILKLQGIHVSLFGENHHSLIVENEILTQYTTVITIGRTTQKCLTQGIPVYCYDQFGGVGFITPTNFNAAAHFNFSGRNGIKKNPQEIAQEVISPPSEEEMKKLLDISRDRFNIDKKMKEVLEKISINNTHNKHKEKNNALRHLRRIYDKQLYLQIFTSKDQDFKESLSTKYQITSDKIHQQHTSTLKNIKYFRIDPLNSACRVAISKLEITNIEDAEADLIYHNAEMANTILTFLNPDPQMVFEFSKPVNQFTIEFSLEYVNIYLLHQS